MKELKRTAPRVLASSVAVLLGLLAPQAAQADQYWNGGTTSGATVPNGAGGSGTWDNATTNWTDVTGTTNTAYDPAQTAFFSTTPGVVTLGATVSITALRFTVDGYVINSGGGFTITPTGTASLNADSGVTATINAQITGGGGISIDGAGTIVINNTNNNYTGGTVLNSGTLQVNGDPTTGFGANLGTGTLTINGGTISTGITVTGNSEGTVISNNITVGGNFSIATNTNANAGLQNLSFTGSIDLGGTTRTITGVTPGGQVQFLGSINNGGVTFNTSAAVTSDPTNKYVAFILNSPNTYTGLTTINSGAIVFLTAQGGTNSVILGDIDIEGTGVLDYGGSNQVADSSNIVVNSTGNDVGTGASLLHFQGLEVRGFTETIGTLTGNGTVGLGAGNASGVGNLSVGSGNFSGVIMDGDFGTFGGLTKYGAGTLILSGANTYTGLTTISAGTLQAGAINTFSSASSILVDSTGTLDLNNFDQNIGALSDDPFVVGAGGTVNLGSATLTTGNNDVNTNFSGVIQGTGGLTKVGTGVFDLTGTNTFTGNTTVNDGALVLGGTSVSPVTVNSHAEFDVDTTGTLNTPAAAAAVTVAGTSAQANNFGAIVGGAVGIAMTGTGGTANNSGTLTGTVGVTVGGTGNFTNNFGSITGTTSGVSVTGTGSTTTNFGGATITAATAVDLTTAPAGTNIVVNGGTMTGTGGVAINSVGSAGAVHAVNVGTINGNITLGAASDTLAIATGSVLNGTANGGAGLNALNLVGTGTDTTDLTKFTNFPILNKLGGGTWTVTGSNMVFTGGTTVGGGTLIVQGNLVSNVQVQTQGILTGTGMVTGNLTNGGVVAPGGGGAGKFRVTGNYFQTSGGTLVIRVGGLSQGQFDQLSIQGQASLDGNLRIEKTGGLSRLKVGQKVQFLTAAGGVTGHFTDVENPFSTDRMIQSAVVYSPNGVSLEGVQGSYAQIRELTPNQVTVARNIDRVIDDPRAKKVVDFLNQEQLSKIPQDLDRIAPEELASVYRIGFSIADVHAQNLQRRTADIRAGSSGFSAAGFQTSGSGPNYSGPIGAHGATGTEAAGKSTVVQAPPDDKWGVFITGTGDFVNVGDSENARGYNMETGGMTVGVDYKVTPHLAVGVNAGYASTSADLANEGHARVVGAKGGVYGTYSQGRFYVDAAVNGGYNSYDTNRSALKGTARGNTDGGEFDAMIGAGYDFKFGDWTIGPTANLQYTYVGIDGFTERGSLAPLAYGDQNADSFRSALGFKTSYDWQVGGVVVRPEIRAAWQHEFGDRGYSIDSRFASGAGDIFSVTDTEIGRDSFLLGAGVAVLWNPRTSTYIYYDGDVGRKDFDSHNVSGGLRLSF